MPKLPVKGLPTGDSGRQLVRLNYKHRKGTKRYGVVELTNNENGKTRKALVLGHDCEDAIFMPYDIRTALGVEPNEELDFSVSKVGSIRRLGWYVSSPDPAVHIPAWIAVVGLILAVAGIVLGVLPLLLKWVGSD